MKEKRLLTGAMCLLTILFCTSCRESSRNHSKECGESVEMKYADYLNITEYPNHKTVEITNPWDTTKILHRYILTERSGKGGKEGKLPEGTVVKIPVERIIVYSSVHASILSELGAADKIVGVCDAEYIVSEELRKRVSAGEVTDCGLSFSPNIERIIETKGDIIIASPFENSNYGAAEKTGIPIIESADYMERTPLGRSEWIKLFGYLLGREERADSLFRENEKRYLSLCEKVDKKIEAGAKRPTMISERKYGSSWGVPGGQSYASILYEDAGAENIFSYLNSAGSVQLPFEKVLEKGMDADIWLIKYTGEKSFSYSDLKAEYPLYGKFRAFNKGKIFGCNTSTTPYYDDIIVHPERILEDLIYLFHPDLLPGYEPRYFLPLEQSR